MARTVAIAGIMFAIGIGTGIGMAAMGVGAGLTAAATLDKQASPQPVQPIATYDVQKPRPDPPLTERVTELEQENAQLKAQVQSLQEADVEESSLPDEASAEDMAADAGAEGEDVTGVILSGLLALATAPANGSNADTQNQEETGANVSANAAQSGAGSQSQADAFDRLHDRLAGFLARHYDATTNPVEQKRLAKLSAYNDQLYALRQQLAKANSPAEAQQTRDQLASVYKEAHQTLKRQQNAVLAQRARALGLKTPKQQAAYANSVRQTMRSPYFAAVVSQGVSGD